MRFRLEAAYGTYLGGGVADGRSNLVSSSLYVYVRAYHSLRSVTTQRIVNILISFV
jgi:hypothetical protein